MGTKDIADALNEANGSDIVKSEVLMPHGVIRELGDYELDLDLGFDVTTTITVSVVGLQSAADVSADGSIIEENEATAEDAAEEGAEDADSNA